MIIDIDENIINILVSLVMHLIFELGTDYLKYKYLPKLCTREYIGTYGLTEPDAGSDPSNKNNCN